MIEAVCVDPARVHEIWPHVKHHIEAATGRCGSLTDFAILENRVLSGGNLLWLAWDGKTILAAAVTSLDLANDKKFCSIVACGGHEFDLWSHLIGRIEQFARDEKCASVVIQGRKGWQRMFPDYAPIATIMEKRLQYS